MSAGNVGITVTPWVPPTNYCPATEAQRVADYLNNSTFAVTQATAQVIISSVQPTQTQQGTIWLQTVGAPPFTGVGPGNATPIALWSYDNTYGWIWPNPYPPSGAERRLWFASESSLQTYDGGDTNAAGLASGPMWAVDHTFDATFILAPGTLPGQPSGTGPGPSVVAVGATGGEQFHQLSTPEMPPHSHGWNPSPGPGLGIIANVNTGGVVTATSGPNLLNTTMTDTGGDPATTPPYNAAQYHNNMPPYTACFVIKRTTRKYYTLADGQ